MNIELSNPYSTKQKETFCKKESETKYLRTVCNFNCLEVSLILPYYLINAKFLVSLFIDKEKN